MLYVVCSAAFVPALDGTAPYVEGRCIRYHGRGGHSVHISRPQLGGLAFCTSAVEEVVQPHNSWRVGRNVRPVWLRSIENQ